VSLELFGKRLSVITPKVRLSSLEYAVSVEITSKALSVEGFSPRLVALPFFRIEASKLIH
jgi:hypothetical protein